MDWMKVADQLAGAAKAVAVIIPQAGAVAGAIEIGKKIAGAIDELTENVPETRGSADLAFAQKELRDAISTKAQSTADRLDG